MRHYIAVICAWSLLRNCEVAGRFVAYQPASGYSQKSVLSFKDKFNVIKIVSGFSMKRKSCSQILSIVGHYKIFACND